MGFWFERPLASSSWWCSITVDKCMMRERSTNSKGWDYQRGWGKHGAFWQISDGGRSYVAAIESLSFDGPRMTIPERPIPVDLTPAWPGSPKPQPSLLTLSHLPPAAHKPSHLIVHRSHQVSNLITRLSNNQDDPCLLLHDFHAAGIWTNLFVLVIATNKSAWPWKLQQ